MGFVAKESIIELQRALDIYEVVNSYIPLKKAGSGYKALCPFHDEKTPSFNVNPHKQIFKCFGCAKGGNAISFVKEYENISFYEAVRTLSEKYGIKLKYSKGFDAELTNENLYKANLAAIEFFIERLGESSKAQEYLASRGLIKETISLFKLGYAPNSWDALLKHLRKIGIQDKVIEQVGVVAKSETGSLYDRFRDRLVFPIFDSNSRPIGFGARTFGNEGPKYINTPETPVFSKGKHLYGANLIKQSPAQEGQKIFYIVEGYFDVILPHQTGIPGFLATLGTSPTKDHIRFIRRYADRVIIAFDPDSAGNMASKRLLDMLISEEINVEVSRLEASMDPSDIAHTYPKDKAMEIFNNTINVFDYLIENYSSQFGTTTETNTSKVVNAMMESIAQVEDPVKQDLFIQRLATKFRVPLETLRKKLNKPPKAAAMDKITRTELPGKTRLSLELLRLVLHENNLIEECSGIIEKLPDPMIKKIVQEAFKMYLEKKDIRVDELLATFADNPKAQEYILNIITDDTKIESPQILLRRLEKDLERCERNERIKELKNEKMTDDNLKKLGELKRL